MKRCRVHDTVNICCSGRHFFFRPLIGDAEQSDTYQKQNRSQYTDLQRDTCGSTEMGAVKPELVFLGDLFVSRRCGGTGQLLRTIYYGGYGTFLRVDGALSPMGMGWSILLVDPE